MKERIKQLRKSLGLNQTEFGDKLGIKQTTVAGYESGARTPLDTVISSMCKEFNANEEWLRYGIGDMITPLDRKDEIAKLTADLFKGEKNSFKERLIFALSGLNENEWAVLEKIAEKIAKEKD